MAAWSKNNILVVQKKVAMRAIAIFLKEVLSENPRSSVSAVQAFKRTDQVLTPLDLAAIVQRWTQVVLENRDHCRWLQEVMRSKWRKGSNLVAFVVTRCCFVGTMIWRTPAYPG